MQDSIIREQVDRLGRPSVEMLDQEIARCERKESYARLLRGALAGLLAVAAAIALITNLWVTVLQIDGSSMNPLLLLDEIVLTLKTDSPAKNDVIAFYHNNKLLIKRVIAAAGDRVDINADGIVSVNERVLDEPYVAEPCLGGRTMDFPLLVPEGMFFVLGDNRPVSTDSRDSRFGLVDKERIAGRVAFRVWPPRRIGKISARNPASAGLK